MKITSGGQRRISSFIAFSSSSFAPIGPPAVGTVHLDGRFQNRAGPSANISFGSVELDGYANVKQIGAVKPKKVRRVASPVAFGPPADPDVTKALDFGVTRLFGRFYFSLDPSDQIVLTDSVTISVVGPERPTPHRLPPLRPQRLRPTPTQRPPRDSELHGSILTTLALNDSSSLGQRPDGHYPLARDLVGATAGRKDRFFS